MNKVDTLLQILSEHSMEIQEALTLKQFREFKYSIIEKKYKKYLDKVFKGKDRLYIPFETVKSTSIKVPSEIKKFLNVNGYEIIDYGKGLAKRKDKDKKNLIRIGKVLKKEPELLKLFQSDKNRSAVKKASLMIVISRHPYDLAGMSTGRGWLPSCMHLDIGDFKEYIHKDIEHGTLVAYVVDTKDDNINKPISRLLLKQYIDVNDPKKTILYPGKIYGENIKGFKERIIKWLGTFQSFTGSYKLNPEVYPDDLPLLLGDGEKKHNDNDIRQLYYKNHPDDEDAKKDDFFYIRGLYYENHPDDEDAKKDDYSYVRLIYYKNHPKDKDAKKDDDTTIRRLYYKNHPDDEDAKEDDDPHIRKLYYKNHPKDKDAKKDDDTTIRRVYYKNHPDDEDAKGDNDLAIRRVYYKNHPEEKSKSEALTVLTKEINCYEEG